MTLHYPSIVLNCQSKLYLFVNNYNYKNNYNNSITKQETIILKMKLHPKKKAESKFQSDS